MEDKKLQKEYEKYVKEVTLTTNIYANILKAFLVGGVICLIGQIIQTLIGNIGISKDDTASLTTLILVLLSVILTGFNIYPKIGKFGGAGSLVPITGFANSVAASAIEFKKEGQVFGIGCKIFTIAGPVILYGIFTSWVIGLIYWIMKCMGVA